MKTPLKFQDSGPDVVELQNLLNKAGETVTVDGVFGAETLAAVRDFQSTHNDATGNPLVVDGEVGSLTLASLQQNTGGVAAGASSFAGFDTAVYPGDGKMTAWIGASPYKFVGYYLPSPFHSDASFMGKRATLAAMGWGFMVVYVGRQATSKPENLTRDRGIAEGRDAIQKTGDEGFGPNTVIFLDVEPMDAVPAGIKEYLKGWISQLIVSPLAPGIYCHIKNAKELQATAIEEYPAGSSKPKPLFWVSGSGAFDPASSVPSGSGISFASVWQGQFDRTETHGGESIQIDVNVADSANPSGAVTS
jgi:peptidoglycan hydrolase-like protein with peptidoglycan-binding domain